MESTKSEKIESVVKTAAENDKINDLNNKAVIDSVNHEVNKNGVKKVDDKKIHDVNINSDSDAQCCTKINNTESLDKLNERNTDVGSKDSCDLVDDERADEPIDDSKENDEAEAEENTKKNENSEVDRNKDVEDEKDKQEKIVKKKTEVEEKKEVDENTKIDEKKTEVEKKTGAENIVVDEEPEEKDKSTSNDSRALSDVSVSNDDGKSKSIATEKDKGKLSTDEVAKKVDGDLTKPKVRPKITNNRDIYCWRCHRDGVEANCRACPRAWHRKCIGGTPPTTDNWICGECASILQAENASTRSPTMAHITVDQLCLVLKYVIGCMKHLLGSEPFWNAVDLKEVPNYMDYVVKPMDLSLLEINVDAKLYGSTDAFMADAKWIQHNCIVFNTCGGEYTDSSKLTNAAKLIIKIARQEVSEYEACPDCYSRGRNIPRANPSWFVEACSKPHPLIWAKLKGFPFWPAKALPRINALGHVDVRFFGAHDRAWIAPKDIYLFSKEPPTSLPKKKRYEMIDCLKEISRHTKKLEMAFGPFTYAPNRTLYNPHDENQIKLLLPQYDPTCFYDLTLINQSHPIQQQLSLNEDTSPRKSSVPVSEKLSEKDVSSSIPVKDVVPMIKKKGGRKRKLSEDPNQVDAKKVVKTRGGRKKFSENKGDDNGIEKTTPGSENLPAQEDTPPTTEEVEPAAPAVNKNNTVPESRVKSRKWLSKKFMPPEKHFYKVRATRLGTKEYYDKPNNLRKTNSSINTHGRGGRATIVRPYKHRAAKIQNSEQDKATGPTTRSSVEEVQDKKKSLSDESSAPNRSETSPSKYSSSSVDSIRPDVTMEIINNLFDNSSNLVPGKRQSKAKKSFPNKPPQIPTRSFLRPLLANNSNEVDDKKIDIPVLNSNGMDYTLPPPEAGPVSTQLNRSASELVRQMARLMEEALKETVRKTNNQEEAGKFMFELEIERMKWEHQQHLAEIKHNTDRTLREMRASLEVERLRAVEEIRKETEDEKIRSIQETKTKQWCASCWQEALYYCCWNTSYCNPSCQQQHWKTHMSKCTQKSSQSNQQEPGMPTLLSSAQLNSSNVRGA
ncbi:zinc finger MYND-type containing 8 [Cotesia typhae]|uniref:zinc finger MYND-type containing 8 n=1 Tax=Cotesia typhae TaxID=2053667 RepID=UPI003D69A1BD